MVVPNGLLAIDLTIFKLWVMETEIWVMEIDEPNTPLFGFLFFLTPHSSLITQFPSLIIHHSSLITNHLKSNTRLAPSFIFHHSTFFILFVGPMLVTESDPSCFVPAEGFHPHFFLFSLFSFLISPSPFSLVTLPKHKPKPPIKISQALQHGSDNAISSVKAQQRRRSVKKHKPSNSHLLL